MYTPEPLSKDTDIHEYLNRELNRLSGALDALRYLRISRKYTLSASATAIISNDDIVTQGAALLSVSTDDAPGTIIFQIDRSGSSNGTWPVLAGPEFDERWGYGTTSEPTDGTDARVWIESAGASARLKVKGLGSTTRTFRIVSVEI